MTKCQNCQRVVTQDEADQANEIFNSGTTLCPECAEVLNRPRAWRRITETPGPLKCVDGEIMTDDEASCSVAKVYGPEGTTSHNGMTEVSDEAFRETCNLFTASPNLLRACRDAEDALSTYQHANAGHLTPELVADLLGVLSDAIKKAEGR